MTGHYKASVPVCQQAHRFRLCSYGNARTGTKQREHASLAHIYQQDEQCIISSLPDKGDQKPSVKSAICQVSHAAALAHHIHNSATTAIPLNQVNATSRWYCHTQGIVVNSRIIIPQGVKAPCHCKRLKATHTDSMSAPTRAVCYNASQPATTFTVQLHETIPYTKCMTECQHEIGTYTRLSTRHVNSTFQHKEQPGIIKLSQTRKANSRLSPTWRTQSRLSPSSPKTQPKLSLTWEVQTRPLSSPEVQCGIFKQPTKACLIDSVPATCEKNYEAITMSFKQGWLCLPNQPMIMATPSPDQRLGNLTISLQRPLLTATQQHPTSNRQGCSRLTSFCQTMHPSLSFHRMSYAPLLLCWATHPRPTLFCRTISQPQSSCQMTPLPLSLSQATHSRPPSSVEQGISSHCSVK